jgi:hypothetical protein
MHSQYLKDLITMYKAMPNGETRNKIISHLKDAYAHAKLLETEAVEKYGPEAAVPTNSRVKVSDSGSQIACTCPEGAIDRNCPTHGTG